MTVIIDTSCVRTGEELERLLELLKMKRPRTETRPIQKGLDTRSISQIWQK